MEGTASAADGNGVAEGRERRATATATGHDVSSAANLHTHAHTLQTHARTQAQVGPASFSSCKTFSVRLGRRPRLQGRRTRRGRGAGDRTQKTFHSSRIYPPETKDFRRIGHFDDIYCHFTIPVHDDTAPTDQKVQQQHREPAHVISKYLLFCDFGPRPSTQTPCSPDKSEVKGETAADVMSPDTASRVFHTE
ncbi:uncharacterized protein LOC111027329 [Myzus persicae]|uniref:uncharacterized protein LOC111027329 n=1 Tax=Myzus persicae TaxID=13164 RepID=UPI000B936A05|nr:uncharacterized protein LOC111027329 [Myzus persicae]